MHKLCGLSRSTIRRGTRELQGQRNLMSTVGHIRRPGGGRKRLENVDPALTAAIEKIMDENTAGDPMSYLRWTNKSTDSIAEELTRQGHLISGDTVGRRLREMEYSLQVNSKSIEGVSPPERDAQFRYINKQVRRFLARGEPVLSIDTKKKEQVGNFKNKGQTYRRKGNPQKVLVHDFPSLGEGAAILYGTYDIDRNEGFVNVGISHDTAEFAVESVRQWWKFFGRRQYLDAKLLLLCADSGGSNGSRNRAWKYNLQQLSNQFGLTITVCHYPPGTSKWNKIEHRMFSMISMNWKGRPLVSYEAILNLIGSTKTKTGLRIRAQLDPSEYETGVEISDEQMGEINLKPHKLHPKWNYTIAPWKLKTK